MADSNGSQPQTVVVDRGGSGAGWVIAIVLIVALVIGGYFLFAQNQSTVAKNNAVTSAAKSVGHAADKVGDTASGKGN